MKLAPIVEELRRRCPSLGQRVHASVEFSDIEKRTNMQMPCAFVLPMSESADEASFHEQTEYRQGVSQSFGVAIFVEPKRQDRTGLDAYDLIEDMKAEVHRALTGWEPSEDANAITYDGMTILGFTRAYLAVQLEFTVTYDIVDTDTRHGVDLSQLPDLLSVGVKVDTALPDGHIEAEADFKLEGGKS